MGFYSISRDATNVSTVVVVPYEVSARLGKGNGGVGEEPREWRLGGGGVFWIYVLKERSTTISICDKKCGFDGYRRLYSLPFTGYRR